MFLIVILAQIYIAVVVLQAALSWLIAFDIVKAENEAAQNLTQLLKKLTDPVYTPLRKYVPPVANIDMTPLIVIIGVQVLLWFLAMIIP